MSNGFFFAPAASGTQYARAPRPRPPPAARRTTCDTRSLRPHATASRLLLKLKFSRDNLNWERDQGRNRIRNRYRERASEPELESTAGSIHRKDERTHTMSALAKPPRRNLVRVKLQTLERTDFVNENLKKKEIIK
ncbi:hypothetical protein EVAR_80687_1 [Eumeta japonica]|uniref:Uncharacterized protein n=1 Tax=Eumeta variegata TaxID=151549 RepID=A0A4C1U3N4_EUMVA|nr:hypothetical protein EVAR_80687_1 [Eumeta japonica]